MKLSYSSFDGFDDLVHHVFGCHALRESWSGSKQRSRGEAGFGVAWASVHDANLLTPCLKGQGLQPGGVGGFARGVSRHAWEYLFGNNPGD